MTKSEKLLATYVKMLEKEHELRDIYKQQTDKISSERALIAKHLVDSGEVFEVPEIICSDSPYLAWQLGEKNDAYAIRLYRVLRDAVSANNRVAADYEAEQNLFKDKIGNWLLAALNKSGAKSVNCGESGKAYKRMKVRVSAADWEGFVSWAVANDAQDAIQKRVNASFVTKYEEENEELPPFLNVSKEYEVVVTK
jgi:predicted metalloendopeptidase